MIATIMTISLSLFFASLPAQFFDKNISIISNLSGTIYTVCFGLRYYGDGLLLATIILLFGVLYLAIAWVWENMEEGYDCMVIQPGQTIRGAGDES